MTTVEILSKFQESLLPVFGLNSLENINPEYSLVKDLGADSIDFVEIIYIIERDFGVVIKTDEIVAGGININAEELFEDGVLTENGATLINKNFPGHSDRFKQGITWIDLFSSLTVKDMAEIIKLKMSKEKNNV